MKHLLLTLLVAGLFGCSSSAKTNHAHEGVSDEAKAAIETAAEDLKNAAEAEQTAAKTKVAEVEETAAATTGGFADYQGTEASKVTCTLGEDVRTVSVLNGATSGCGVVYNKMGADKTVAVANYAMNHCSNTQDKIKGNLAAAGFACM